MSSQSYLNGYNLLSPEVAFNPYPVLHKLRADKPVYWSPQFDGWVLTRYDDIVSALRSPFMTPTTMTERLHLLPRTLRELLRPLKDSISLCMGHTTHKDQIRMQNLLKSYFTPHTVERIGLRTQEIADELIFALQDQGQMDVVRDLANPLSASVMAEIFGMPTKDQVLLQEWSRGIHAIFDPLYDVDHLFDSHKSLQRMSEYVRQMITERRHAPGEDLISFFVEAQAEGQIHSEEEILTNYVLLLFATHETTANLISNGLLALLQNPDELSKLKKNPDLLDSAIEEMLRYEAPTQLIARMAVSKLQIGEKKILPHQLVFMILSAANRDPAKFPNPDQFDITRKKNRHLAFGGDSFDCLAASLGRMQANICFRTLLRRMPNLRPNFDSPSWQLWHPFKRTLHSLPVRF